MTLGYRLRDLRKQAGIEKERQAAEAIGISASKLSRMESGQGVYWEKDLRALIELYRVGDEESARLMALAAEAHKRGWWADFDGAKPEFMECFSSLEDAAYRINTYNAQFIPGLLQTKAYAHAVISSGPSKLCQETVRRKVEWRTSRQEQIFNRDGLEAIRIVIDESALRRAWGGKDVILEQLRHIRKVVEEHPHVTVRVAAFEPAPSLHCGPMTIFELQDQHLPHIVYLEQRHNAEYLDDKKLVDGYRASYDELAKTSRPRLETPGIIDWYLRHHR